MTVLYRIYTEDKGADSAAKIPPMLRLYGIDGATILRGTGLYKGEQENALIIEIVADKGYHQAVYNLALDIKRYFRQESVLITWQDMGAYSI